MVRDRWYVVLEGREVRRRPVGITRLGRELVAWRDTTGRVCITDDRCPHRRAALSAGTVVDDTVQCPFHGFRFRGDGVCTAIPSNGDRPVPANVYDVRSYAVREAHGYIWLWWGDATVAAEPDLPPIPWFDWDETRFSYSTSISEWPVHISRCVENQLDMAHLPFVHHNTIGRGLPTAVKVETEVDGDRIRFWNAGSDTDVRLTFIAPGLWCLHISDSLIQHLAFVPIDEGHTRQYLRAYQAFVTWPVLGDLFSRVSSVFNGVVLNQDKRVVLTQDPPRSDQRPDEKLVQADAPIAAYRRWLRANAPATESDGARPAADQAAS